MSTLEYIPASVLSRDSLEALAERGVTEHEGRVYESWKFGPGGEPWLKRIHYPQIDGAAVDYRQRRLSIEDCRDLAHELMPEHFAYIFAVNRDQFGLEVPGPLQGQLLGECRKLIGPAERAFIEARGEWAGVAPLVTINEELFDDPAEVVGVLCHELAHAAVGCRFTADPPKGDDVAADHREWMNTMVIPLLQSSDLPPWAGHGARFIRDGLHLAYRAVEAGRPLDFDALAVGGEHYGLSDGRLYLAALGDELERLADVPITEINAIEAPEAFTELFNSDVEAWEQQNANAD